MMSFRLVKLCFALLGLASFQTSMACDACGCSILGTHSPLLANLHNHYISLNYAYAGSESIALSGEGSKDQFYRVDLSGQYQLTERLSFQFLIPYKVNVRSIAADKRAIQGFSDVRLDANYVLFQSPTCKNNFNWSMETNGGIILPVGKFDPLIHDSNLPENFNPGNGSFGFTLGETTSLSHSIGGVLLKNQFSTFTSTASGYRFGNQWSSTLTLYTTIKAGKTLQVLPLSGLTYESIGKDRYANDNTVHGTGGHGVFTHIGIQGKMKNWLLATRITVPIKTAFGDGEVGMKNRFECSITHLL